MEFLPEESLQENLGENAVWSAVQRAFKNEEGIAYSGIPLYTPDGQNLTSQTFY